jgi:hypothetical protein
MEKHKKKNTSAHAVELIFVIKIYYTCLQGVYNFVVELKSEILRNFKIFSSCECQSVRSSSGIPWLGVQG